MKTIVGIIIAIAVLGGGWYLFTQSGMIQSGDSMMEDTMLEGSEMPDNGMVGGDAMVEDEGSMMAEEGGTMMEAGVKEFTVEASNFKFTPNTMTVKKGDTVRIIFKNTGGFHDFVIDEFKVATKQIQGGNQDTVEFIADKTGSFEYYCSIGTHRLMGMKGTLTVTE